MRQGEARRAEMTRLPLLQLLLQGGDSEHRMGESA